MYLREADHAQSTGGVCHLTNNHRVNGFREGEIEKKVFYRGDVTVYMVMYMCRFNYMCALRVPTHVREDVVQIMHTQLELSAVSIRVGHGCTPIRDRLTVLFITARYIQRFRTAPWGALLHMHMQY